MRKTLFLALLVLVNLSCSFIQDKDKYCLTGAFLADKPSRSDILNFKEAFGKKPYLVTVFLDWNKFLDKEVIDDIYGEDCLLVVTWEPWNALAKEGIDFDGLISGKFDKYIRDFSLQLKNINKPVFLRFAHEPNGDWYPWAGKKIGRDKYVAAYRHIHDIFKEVGAKNVKWIFCLNWEDRPRDNKFSYYYPGDEYVDYVGLDGYNWGKSQPWGRWMSFKEIFFARYQEVVRFYKKPVIITEFSSVSADGDKGPWIQEALKQIRLMDKVRGFIIFNIDKERDWGFKPDAQAGAMLKKALVDDYFKAGIGHKE